MDGGIELKNNKKYLQAMKEAKALYLRTKPPEIYINEVKNIANRHLKHDEVEEFFIDLFSVLNIDMHEEAIPCFKLSTGYEVFPNEYSSDNELVEHLLNAVNGELMTKYSERYFDEPYELLLDEVKYLCINTWQGTKEFLLQYLLVDKLLQKRKGLIEGAFPEIFKAKSIVPLLMDYRTKFVLILGKDTGEELKLLHEIRNSLKKYNFHGILIKEHEDLLDQSLIEKVSTFSKFCNFVLLEDSYAAGQMVEQLICELNKSITLVLRQEGKGSSYMAAGYSIDNPNIKEIIYNLGKPETLENAIRSGIEWVSLRKETRTKMFSEIYPWRKSQS